VIPLGAERKIVVASKPVDFRKSINGLAALVAEALRADPYCGTVFVFRSKRKDRIKWLVWDGSGMILATKWLESGGFTWPPVSDGAVYLSPAQMVMLLNGLDWTKAYAEPVKRPRII
jgi:transposase